MNHLLIDALRESRSPDGVAVESGDTRLSGPALLASAEQLAARLRDEQVNCLALHLDNGADWIVADLACQLASIPIVPLPLFFSAEQVRHAIAASGADAILADRLRHVPADPAAALPQGTQKITFTSGTTGKPKGVCLSTRQQLTLASSLATVIDIESPTHLCVLPLSTLLENLAGVYAPLLAGGRVIAPPLAEVGLTGSSGLDPRALLASIDRYQPDSLILVPEMLKVLTLAAAAGWQPPSSLKFVAVGGGRVSPSLLLRARQASIPAFEGYGLSECASVVCLNVPAADRIGAVGRPLPHVQVRAVHGEIVVEGSTFLGYANQPDSWHQAAVRTGDLGRVSADGWVNIDGRLKHQVITSFGRNLSPEWVESELLAGPLLQQAVVIGEDRPCCVALVAAGDPATGDAEIDNWIEQVNQGLPDYARVAAWHRLPQPLSSEDGLLTDNGRPKRSNIEEHFAGAIDALYESRPEVSCL